MEFQNFLFLCLKVKNRKVFNFSFHRPIWTGLRVLAERLKNKFSLSIYCRKNQSLCILSQRKPGKIEVLSLNYCEKEAVLAKLI